MMGENAMANCPACGKHLKLTDYKPNCPHCGVNIPYYNIEERLQEEADVAEVEHVKVQKKIDRLKASFVGSPLTIIRIFLSLLPIGALMLPLCSITFSGPLIEQRTTDVNAITLYNYVSKLNFDNLFTMIDTKLVGAGFTALLVAVATILLSAVMVLVSFLALTCANGPKGKIRNIINNCIAIVFAVVAPIAFTKFASSVNAAFPQFFSGKIGVGVFVYIATLVILLVLNIIIAKKNEPVKYKQCYVGGIPAEEYEEMIANGVSMEEIHKKMDAILAEKDAERTAEEERKAAERKAKEEEELARKAGVESENSDKE